MKDFKAEFLALVESALKETGGQLLHGTQHLVEYAANRAAYLATITNEPGFEEAVKAERDSVALHAAIGLSQNAHAADARLIGIIHGALFIGARLAAGA